MPSPSAMQVTDGAVRLELARGPLVSLVTLRRSDGMPVEIEAWVRGDPARTCVLGRRRGDRALRVGGTPLSLAGDLETTVVPCCNREALVSIRIAVARLVIGPPDRLSRWSETARPIERIRDDRWLRRTFREADIVRERQPAPARGAIAARARAQRARRSAAYSSGQSTAPAWVTAPRLAGPTRRAYFSRAPARRSVRFGCQAARAAG